DRHRVDLVFVLPSLDANKTATYKAVISDKKYDPFAYFHGKDLDKGSEWRFGDRLVMGYVSPKLDESSAKAREEPFKVFHHVYAPSGKFLLTKDVGGLYTHHRGIFYGFMKVTYGKTTVDIWHCKNDTHQAHASVKQHSAGRVLADQRLEI